MVIIRRVVIFGRCGEPLALAEQTRCHREVASNRQPPKALPDRPTGGQFVAPIPESEAPAGGIELLPVR